MQPKLLFMASVFGFLVSYGYATKTKVCASYDPDNDQHTRIHINISQGALVVRNYATEKCMDDMDSCFTTWRYNSSEDRVYDFRQGCWKDSEMVCDSEHCKTVTSNSVKFCCCQGNICNIFFTKSQLQSGKQEHRMIGDQARKTTDPKTVSPINKEEDYTYCAYYDMSHSEVPPNRTREDSSDENGIVLPGTNTVQCNKADSCYTLWYHANNDSDIAIMKQGCWYLKCESDACLSNRQIKMPGQKDTKFCCCQGNMCNSNFTDIYDPSQHTTQDPLLPDSHLENSYHKNMYKEKTIIISLVSVCSVALITIGLYLLYRLCLASHKSSPDLLASVESQPTSGFDIEDLKLCNQISHGRYGNVWRGMLGERNVAVKIFSSNHRQLYQNEKYIYTLPFFEHENLLKFYGGDEQVSPESTTQYLLVLSYIPNGCLQTYLKTNTVDWSTFCKMCLTIAKGLTHLHTDIRKGGYIGTATSDEMKDKDSLRHVKAETYMEQYYQFKPSIAHRDINSRNILVNNDLSCIIGDFGFGLTMMGSKIIRNGHYENAEHSSLQDVGTLRYMAPELLDGAANLRESESSLKQIDVYAQGLVMWEISSRCSDLYQGVPTPEYMLPFQKEAGNHPSFEEMQILVSRNKVRPKFPEVWKDYNQAIRALKETIEDCWDHDAEARLTAMCVEERISDIMTLWSQDTKHKGLTPTITTTSNLFEALTSDTTDSHLDVPDPHSIMANGHVPMATREQIPNIQSDSSTAHLVNSPPNGFINGDIVNQRSSTWQQDWSVSDATTDTLLPLSPSENELSHPPQKQLNIAMAKNNMVLRPHQGRNPTVERNTHKRSDEELAVSGNTLVYGNERSDSVQSAPTMSDDTFDGFGDNLESSLVQNDVLNHHRSHPISYVQNQVHDTSHPIRPKVANLPGNNLSNPQPGPSRATESRHQKHKLGKFMVAKELGNKLGQQLGLLSKFVGRSSDSSDSVRNSKEFMSHINTNFDHSLTTGGQSSRTSNYSESSQRDNGHSNLNVNVPIPTEVKMSNGTAVVRPASLNVSNLDAESSRSSQSEGLHPNRLGVAEVGVAKLEMLPQCGHQSVIKIRKSGQYSKSTSDLSPQKTKSKRWSETGFAEGKFCQQKRPNSLSLKGHNYNSHLGESKTCSDLTWLLENSKVDNSKKDVVDSRLKIKRRVKTPLSMKHGRFSLYDDRLMTDYMIQNPESLDKMQKSSSSLQQLECLDRNANSYIATDHNC